jgi:hypothetical protein
MGTNNWDVETTKNKLEKDRTVFFSESYSNRRQFFGTGFASISTNGQLPTQFWHLLFLYQFLFGKGVQYYKI